MEGLVFNIQRFSIHDGPGIRTTVFLKGCSLHCFWCHNPEGIRPKQDLQFFPERCIGCNECVRVCPREAVVLVGEQRVFDRQKCDDCGICVDTCFSGARTLAGRRITVDEVIEEVMQDRPFYETSGGGVTLSGGEPAFQAKFSAAILQRCKAAGLHTAIETCANVHWEDLAMLLAHTDLVMMDLKHMDPAKHRWATGSTNERLLANARRLVMTGKPILFRIPVIPTVNDTVEEVSAIARYVKELVEMRNSRAGGDGASPGGSISLELLPFHRLAGDKYRSLGLEYRAKDLQTLGKDRMATLVEAAQAQGITARGR